MTLVKYGWEISLEFYGIMMGRCLGQSHAILDAHYDPERYAKEMGDVRVLTLI